MPLSSDGVEPAGGACVEGSGTEASPCPARPLPAVHPPSSVRVRASRGARGPLGFYFGGLASPLPSDPVHRAHPDSPGPEALSSAPEVGEAQVPAVVPATAARASSPWWSRSLLLSVGAHVGLAAAAFGLYRVSVGRAGEAASLPTVRLERSLNADVMPDELPEPEPIPDVPRPHSEPELVESIITPEPWPEDAAPEGVPLDDLFTGVPAFKRAPEPEPLAVAMTEPVEVEPPLDVEVVEATVPIEPPPAVAAAPRVLTGDELPDVIEGPLPRYPRQALRMQWQGTVRLRIRVDAQGAVIDVAVSESSGHDVLDDAAVEAFERWVFAAKREGDPDVRVLGKPFTFRIR